MIPITSFLMKNLLKLFRLINVDGSVPKSQVLDRSNVSMNQWEKIGLGDVYFNITRRMVIKQIIYVRKLVNCPSWGGTVAPKEVLLNFPMSL